MPKKNTGYRKEWRQERKVFEIIWYERGKRFRKTTGTDDSKQADRFLSEFIKDEERRSVSRVVSDILADYSEEHAPHTASPASIGYAVKNLLPFFGDLSVEEITKAKCQEYSKFRKPAKNETIRKELNIFKAALNHDYEENRIEKVPPVWMPPPGESKDRWLTRKEAAALLLEARKGPWYLPWFILISLYSGQRKGAVLNLTWDRVDLENGKINWQYGIRTNKRRPKQPMPDELKMFLRYISRYGTRGFVLHKDGEKLGEIKKALSGALKRAKIKDVTPHTLRHTAVTWMLQSGTDIWSISGFTGISLKTIENTYGHHASDYMEEARTSSKRARAKRRPL